jgi:hypothetical protein
MLVGTIGVGAMLKGAKGIAHAAHKRTSHVGWDEQRAHEILAQAGPDAAILLVPCDDQETGKSVAAAAADRASYSWDGSMSDVLAGLQPGSEHDWVRAALNKPKWREELTALLRAAGGPAAAERCPAGDALNRS